MKNYARKLILSLLVVLLFCFQASAALPSTLVPGGAAVGLVMNSGIIYVTGTAEHSAAQKAGIEAGDTICAVNGQPVCDAETLAAQIAESSGKLTLRVSRDGTERTVTLEPEQTLHGRRIGIYVRGGVTGVGTLTFYDPQTHTYGALGHGVCLPDSGKLLSFESGSIVQARIGEIVRGQAGHPGALRGILDENQTFGTLEKNTSFGIFGATSADWQGDGVAVADASQVQTGAAEIRATVNAQTSSYAIEILQVHPEQADGRNLLIQVTDPLLLEQTGGIVQGMSGSPILQNGRLIGAVTHVLVDTPEQGYGILIENMLTASGKYDTNR